MYSPADLPSSTRAAPAKKRRLSAQTGSSSFAYESGLPTFRDSSSASSSACSSLAEAEIAEDPDRQRVLIACSEGRHDDLVEREREREQRSCDERSRDDGQRDETEGLPAVRAKVHRRFGQRGLRPAQPGDDVVVD